MFSFTSNWYFTFLCFIFASLSRLHLASPKTIFHRLSFLPLLLLYILLFLVLLSFILSSLPSSSPFSISLIPPLYFFFVFLTIPDCSYLSSLYSFSLPLFLYFLSPFLVCNPLPHKPSLPNKFFVLVPHFIIQSASYYCSSLFIFFQSLSSSSYIFSPSLFPTLSASSSVSSSVCYCNYHILPTSSAIGKTTPVVHGGQTSVE